MRLLLFLLMALTTVYSQDARGDKPRVKNSELSLDSMNYTVGVKCFKDGYKQDAKYHFMGVFRESYSKWHDSTVNFLKKYKRLKWIQYLSEREIRGYNYEDSLFFEVGMRLFDSESFEECKRYFAENRNYEFKNSIYSDSAYNIIKWIDGRNDSLRMIERFEKEQMERKWVYVGDFYDEDKYGKQSYYAYTTYYDINHLLYEGDSVCVMLKVGETSPAYRYVSINLTTRHVHGIDASSYYGRSYSYVWDGDWWKDPESDFSRELYRIVVEKK